MARPAGMILLFLYLGWLVCRALAIPINTSLICVRTSALDVLLFLLENYISHAGTTLARPGAQWYDTMLWKVVVVFVPFASLRYTIELITGKILSWGKKDDLHAALSREALMVVARSGNWEPRVGDRFYVKVPSNLRSDDSTSSQDCPSAALAVLPCRGIDGQYRAIHGNMQLPPGYCWSELRSADKDLLRTYERNPQIHLSKSSSWLQTSVSIAQLIFSTVTLYRTRGSQINRYGFAAFGLSVFPYTLMSFVNLFGSIILGDYPYMYVLRTEVLKEAGRREGAVFDGCIGYLKPDEEGEGSPSVDIHPARLLALAESRPSTEGTQVTESPSRILVVTVGEKEWRFKLKSSSESAQYRFEVQPITNNSYFRSSPSTVRIELTSMLRLIWSYAKQASSLCATLCLSVLSQRKNNPDKPIIQAHEHAHVSRGDSASRIFAVSFEVILVVVASFLPYVFIYLMTGFSKQSSTPAQQGWLMAWICVGQFFGATVVSINRAAFTRARIWYKVFLIWVVVISIVTSVGGYVQVISMYLEFGSCSLPPS
ncbi:hypothetical protein OE88DRAFT_1733231 [Heliocybe sulcata]|uniref:Uncharacterized protein n=1 Tax=Heliocybe sulcata TaxID=5364 RepID=A0A5C3NB93_9AGAM|nr:hypothetical protein OE88DRAFT_1733231 [Heliocybe sulcata]